MSFRVSPKILHKSINRAWWSNQQSTGLSCGRSGVHSWLSQTNDINLAPISNLISFINSSRTLYTWHDIYFWSADLINRIYKLNGENPMFTILVGLLRISFFSCSVTMLIYRYTILPETGSFTQCFWFTRTKAVFAWI